MEYKRFSPFTVPITYIPAVRGFRRFSAGTPAKTCRDPPRRLLLKKRPSAPSLSKTTKRGPDPGHRISCIFSQEELIERYRSIVEAFDGIIYICSPDYRIEFMNGAGIARTGRDATGELCYRALHDRETACPWCVNDRVLRGETVRWEVQSPKDGRWYFVTDTPIRNPDGSISKQALIQDITERKLAEEALQKSDERFRLSMEATSDGVWDWDVPTRTGYFSPAYYRMLGYQPGSFAVTAENWEKLIHPDDRALALQVHMDCAGGRRESVEVEFRMKTSDGGWRWILGRGKPVAWDENGRPIRLMGTHLDITDRKRAEEALRRDAAIFRGINRILEAAITSRTEEELGEACLSTAEEITGSRFGFIGEITPQGTLDDICISDPGWAVCKAENPTGHHTIPGGFKIHGIYGRVLADGKGFYTNDPASHPDRIGIPVGHPPLESFLGVPLRREGRTIGMIAVGNNRDGYRDDDLEALEKLAPAIVQAFARKRAEESEERLRTLMDHNPCLVFLKDEGGRYAYLNKAYEEEFVLTREWHGKTDFDLWPKESAELFRDNDAKVLASGRTHNFIEESKDRHGKRHSWFCYKFPFTDSKGNRYLGGIGIDATDRIRAEEALRRSDELKEGLNRINSIVHSTRDFGDIVKHVLQEGREALAGESAAFAVRENDGWRVLHVSGMPAELVGTRMTDEEEPHAVLATTSREPVAISDAWNDPRIDADHMRRHGVRSVLAVPLLAGGEACGVIFFNYHSGPHTFVEAEISFGRQLATTTAIAFQNARVMEELERTARELSEAKTSLEATVAQRTMELAGTVERLKLEVGHRAAAEATLRKNEALLRTVLETLPVGVALIDAGGLPCYANPALLQIWEGEIRDHDAVRQYKPGSDVPIAPEERPVAITLRTGEPVLGAVLEMESSSGNRKTLIKSVAPITLRDGSNAGAVCVTQDVTRQQELQKQLLHAQKLESIGSLAGGVAHDFNNILTAIHGYAESVYDELEDDELRDDLRQVLDAGERAAELTRKLLAFSRQQVTETAPMSLTETVESVLAFVARLIGAQIDVRREISPERLMIRGSRGQIEQVLVNILLNARDAITDTGAVTVRTGRIKAAEAGAAGLIEGTAYAFVEIADTGAGIPPQNLDRIFEPYFTTKESGKGTGLGMAIAYGIVRQHEGVISVRSSVGDGTTFTVYFPLTLRRRKEVAEQHRGEVPGGKETVLVVEDEPAVRSFIVKSLGRAGYEVLTAANGDEALAALREHPVDLVLTDVIMPGMNGMEMFRRMSQFLPGLKVIFASGYSADIVTAKGPGEENFRFLQKPVAKATLLAAVREALDEGETGLA